MNPCTQTTTALHSNASLSAHYMQFIKLYSLFFAFLCVPLAVLLPWWFLYSAVDSKRGVAALRSTFTHLGNNNTYIKMLLVDFGSAVNCITPWNWLALAALQALVPHYSTAATLKKSPGRSDWRPNPLTLLLNNGATKGCALSLLLFLLYTHDCYPRHGENFCEVCRWHYF